MQRYFNPRLNFKLAQYKTEQFYIPDVRAHCGNISDKNDPFAKPAKRTRNKSNSAGGKAA